MKPQILPRRGSRSSLLYRFVKDRKRGDVKGNGFKDVGTWRVATVGKATAPATTSTSTSTTTPTYPYP